MRLSELDPFFIRRDIRHELKLVEVDGVVKEVMGDVEYHIPVDGPAESDGIMFLCPKCFRDNGGAKGTHRVLCWRPKVPPEVDPKPGRWEFQGSGIDDLSLVAGSSSILLNGPGCQAHFFISGGAITW